MADEQPPSTPDPSADSSAPPDATPAPPTLPRWTLERGPISAEEAEGYDPATLPPPYGTAPPANPPPAAPPPAGDET